MTAALTTRSRRTLAQRVAPGRGINSFEVLVALTLLITALSLSVPLVVRHNRLLTSARHYRLACDELSNQLERLTALPADELEQALDDLEVSEFTAAHLPQAELAAALAPADMSQRLRLSITWGEPGRLEAPLAMTAWVFPEVATANAESDETDDADADADAEETQP